jgi:hypothetical protein
MILDFPRLKVRIDKSFISNGEGFEDGYIFAVTLLENRPLLFTVHLESGAIYSRLPLKAFENKLYEHMELTETELENVDPWGAISSFGQVIKHEYLKDYAVKVRNGESFINGMYWATIDYMEGGFAQDPEQHKTSNIILLENGQIGAYPNNHCLFVDRHFTKEDPETQYRRNDEYFTLE